MWNIEEMLTAKEEKTSPSWVTGSCDGLVIYWFFEKTRFYIFNFKDM